MLSKNRIKLIRSLEMKKHRMAERLFVAEGPKLVSELLRTYRCRYLAGTREWWDSAAGQPLRGKTGEALLELPTSPAPFSGKRPCFPGQAAREIYETDLLSEEELRRCSLQKHPQQVIALFVLPDEEMPSDELYALPGQELCLALDNVQDPGNLGTIIRVADWFGIRHVFCSPDTADAYAPKAIQATMGSLGRVALHYGALPPLLEAATRKQKLPVYGTYLEGTPIKKATLENKGLLLMGNEGKGISGTTGQYVNRRLFIPPYPAWRAENDRPESLNVAIATAVICAEFRSRMAAEAEESGA